MNKLLRDLDIDETFTKPIKKKQKYNKVKDNIPLVADANFMADTLFLPTDKQGYKYLLVAVDLATDEFDIEPMKNKSSATALKAMKTMFTRKHINKPHASIRTDAGTEFKDEFQKYLYEESILHKTSVPGRHSQTSSVESLNRILGRVFNGYMNKVEVKTGVVYREWTDIIDIVRKDLNIARKKKTYDPTTHKYPIVDTSKAPNKFKVGDMVYYQLDTPRNSLNEKVYGEKFREGDLRWNPIAKKIKQVLYYTGNVTYRYMLNDIPNASYAEHQLMEAPDDDEKDEIKQVIDRRFFYGEQHYRVWMYGELKKNSGWYAKSDLLKTIDKKLLDDFDKGFAKKKKK
jgi:hypothetical protein